MKYNINEKSYNIDFSTIKILNHSFTRSNYKNYKPKKPFDKRGF